MLAYKLTGAPLVANRNVWRAQNKTMYYYLNINDLNEEAKNELFEYAKELAQKKYTEEDAKDAGMEYEDFILEKADQELWNINFVFNL